MLPYLRVHIMCAFCCCCNLFQAVSALTNCINTHPSTTMNIQQSFISPDRTKSGPTQHERIGEHIGHIPLPDRFPRAGDAIRLIQTVKIKDGGENQYIGVIEQGEYEEEQEVGGAMAEGEIGRYGGVDVGGFFGIDVDVFVLGFVAAVVSAAA